MSETSGIKFRPVMASEERIKNTRGYNSGWVYVATDTGAMFMDVDTKRIRIGGSTSSTGFVWADGNETTIVKASDDDADTTYIIDLEALEDQTIPKVDSLILNSDGRFFRITAVDADEGKITANLIAVSGSGSGGGGGGSVAERDVDISWDTKTIATGSVYVYQKSYNAYFTPTTTAPGDNECDVIFTIIDKDNNNATTTINYPGCPSGQKMAFNTAQLPHSTNITLRVTVLSANSQYNNGEGYSRNIINLKTVEIGINSDPSITYIPIIEPNAVSRSQILSYKPYADTGITLTQHVYVDDVEIPSLKEAIPTSMYNKSKSVAIPEQSHGVHTVKFNVSASVNNEDIYADGISYEAAWAEDGNTAPIIWIGSYDPLIVNYETSYITFMVYDPQAAAQSEAATVILYKDSSEVGQMSVEYDRSKYTTWDISTLYTVEGTTSTNVFSIACRTTKVDIALDVTTVGSRDLSLRNSDSLMLNFSTAGRSNSEIASQRAIFKDTTSNTNAILTGFNWKNNGWNSDAVGSDGIDNGSYLTLANGAGLTIPFQSVTLNSSINYTVEMRFRIRNVQKYSTLVKSYAKYYINIGTEENPVKSSVSYTAAEIEANGYSLYYDEYGSPLMDDNVVKTYEQNEGIVCKWMYNNNGICIGSQEAYFASPRGVISVRYKEDEVINISIVISKTDGLCYIYLNGILSGADSLPPTGESFLVNSNFIFNSDYCDVDLYRFRVYQCGLEMPDVIHNYLSDIHSITLYDQNQMTSEPTKLSYEKLIEYNKNHPSNPTMPYAVWKVLGTNKVGQWGEQLPYYKGNKIPGSIVFVNPALDKALEDGLIDEWYYYTHSPSYEAIGVELNVQGTSSQGYPRRNFKTKFKSAAPSESHPEYGWFYTKGSLAGESLTSSHTVQDKNSISHTLGKKYHMDNEFVGVNKFTWKIDYMESSGSYNTGFANLMGNKEHPLYSKHPLDDYHINGVSTSGLRTTIYGFPVLVFHEYEDASYNVSEPGETYEYVGRYNMNLDKSANESYGFELEKEQPYVAPRQRTITDATTGETSVEEYQPTIAEIAECWEMKDNQGTWCSFKYPSAADRAAGFGALQSGTTDCLEAALHFEYRYSYYGDQIDAIGADGKYDGQTDKQKIIDEIGTTNSQKSAYLRTRLANFEILFNWLDSTNQEEATNATLSTPLTVVTNKPYTGIGENSEPVVAYNVATVFDSSQTYYISDGNGGYTAIEGSSLTNGFEAGVIYYTYSISYYNTTFNNDTAGYRLEKFRTEFNDHLDKEYCLTYFVLTELLLCYDSRGKNMMMASFGPQRVGGNYIWYPIFYDIDTQLGLNNSGAYLWDYDADVTKDGLFSTPTSVLWTNLYAAFESDIKNKYRVLRGLDDGSGSAIVGSLTYDNIAGAYQCNPEVFDSYAMKGIRPIIAIGLDEYVKYFATTTSSGVGYFDTKGELILEAAPSYAYACQGDKLLTTELLLRNRLNYIDSWWLGGSYHINQAKQGQLQLRVSGNRAALTSDKFLDVDNPTSGFTKATYPKAYYDARPGYRITPFLKQYVSYFTDEVPGEPVKYEANEGQEDGVWTAVPASTLSAYQTTPETPNEQLNYIAGMDYVSSLGDLSTSYVSEFRLATGKRLLDLILGSDAPDYYNQMVNSNTIFTLNMSATDSGNKPLMKKMVFTGLTTLDKTLDITGSAKLQEFRALKTIIPNVYFADGAPLHTVHLPSTIQSLSLVENNDLTRILTSKPIVAVADESVEGGVSFSDPATYRGLYIENLTDATNSGTGHALASLVVDGGGLGYEAYKLLEKFVQVKDGTDQKVKIGMLNQYWSPYIQVESGEAYDPNVQYYQINDHSMFDEFTFTTAADWARDTLNGTIYTFDSTAEKSTIKDLSLFDKFLDAYDIALAAHTESQWGMKETTSSASVPTITGTLYVDNTSETKIKETDLTEKYGVRWPKLSIQAAYVQTANITKYVQPYESGRLETLEILRTGGNSPLQPTGTAPTIPYYDFIGWSAENPYVVSDPTIVLSYDSGTDSYSTTEAWSALAFDNDNTVITLYAVFTPHVYPMTFRYKDDTLIDVVGTAYGSPINVPSTVPHMDESSLLLEEKYAFLGWGTSPESISPVNIANISATRSMTFYAMFDRVSVHSNPLDYKYLIFGEPTSYTDRDNNQIMGVEISLNTEYALEGKITLPTIYTNPSTGVSYPVVRIKSGNGSSYSVSTNGFAYDNAGKNNITHIFWDNLETAQLQSIGAYAFTYTQKLLYFEMPASTYRLYEQAFSNSTCPAFNSLENILYIDMSVFNSNIGKDLNGEYISTIQIVSDNTITFNSNYQFAYMTHLTNLIFGSETKPAKLAFTSTSQAMVSSLSGVVNITIYTDNVNDPNWDSSLAIWNGQPMNVIAI